MFARPAKSLPSPFAGWFPDIFALGQLTIIDGDPGLGKSLLMLDLAARLSRGQSWPGGNGVTESRQHYLSHGRRQRRCAGPAPAGAGCQPGPRVFLPLERSAVATPLSFPANVGFLDRAIQKSGARLVVIDPVIAFLDAGILSGSDEGIRRALYPLARLAHEHQCAVILIRHLNKRAGGRSLYRGGGSIGFVAHCRSAWLVGREPAHSSLPPVPNPTAATFDSAAPAPLAVASDQLPPATPCILAQQKNNNGPLQPSLRYQIVAHESGYPTLLWLGACALTADELVATPPRLIVKPRGRAVRFLKRILAAGPVTTDEIWKAGLEHDLFERTLRRAKDDLGIRAQVAWVNGSRRCFWMLDHQELPQAEPRHPDIVAFEEMIEEMNKKYPPLTPLDDPEMPLPPEPIQPRAVGKKADESALPETASNMKENAVHEAVSPAAEPPSAVSGGDRRTCSACAWTARHATGSRSRCRRRQAWGFGFRNEGSGPWCPSGRRLPWTPPSRRPDPFHRARPRARRRPALRSQLHPWPTRNASSSSARAKTSCITMPPMGKSLWCKKVKDGQLRGIKAKTWYPARPDDWPSDYWGPDEVFSLIRGGLMNGKSIGFLRLKSHAPSSHEIAATRRPTPDLTPSLPIIQVPFTSEDQVQEAIRRQLTRIDAHAMIEDAIDRAKGRI